MRRGLSAASSSPDSAPATLRGWRALFSFPGQGGRRRTLGEAVGVGDAGAAMKNHRHRASAAGAGEPSTGRKGRPGRPIEPHVEDFPERHTPQALHARVLDAAVRRDALGRTKGEDAHAVAARAVEPPAATSQTGAGEEAAGPSIVGRIYAALPLAGEAPHVRLEAERRDLAEGGERQEHAAL